MSRDMIKDFAIPFISRLIVEGNHFNTYRLFNIKHENPRRFLTQRATGHFGAIRTGASLHLREQAEKALGDHKAKRLVDENRPQTRPQEKMGMCTMLGCQA